MRRLYCLGFEVRPHRVSRIDAGIERHRFPELLQLSEMFLPVIDRAVKDRSQLRVLAHAAVKFINQFRDKGFVHADGGRVFADFLAGGKCMF